MLANAKQLFDDKIRKPYIDIIVFWLIKLVMRFTVRYMNVHIHGLAVKYFQIAIKQYYCTLDSKKILIKNGIMVTLKTLSWNLLGEFRSYYTLHH